MWADVEALLAESIEAGTIPGAALSVQCVDGWGWRCGLGHAELRPRRRPVVAGLPWDLASLTKVLCTTSVAMRLVDEGLLSLDASAAQWVPGLAERITVSDLLQHGSGLPAWRPLYTVVDSAGLPWGSVAARGAVLDDIVRGGTEVAPGTRHRYSDLGFLVLGTVLERVGGDRIDRLFERLVRAPSGADLRWGWPGAAATEDCPVRGRVIVGEVHDLNAAGLGGIAPHAGLFGSADSVAALGTWLLRARAGGCPVLSSETVRTFWQYRGVGSHRLGWDGVTPGGSSAGARWPLDGVGHLAFTGCSLWIAPEQGVVVALCTNRLHPEIEGGAVPDAPVGPRYAAFKALRPALHTAVIAALEADGRWNV